MITPVNSKSTPNQAGDIYYSILFSFVKPVSKDFSKNLRPSPDTMPYTIRRFFVAAFVAFEENTSSNSNRYHIKYTRIRTLSSEKQKKT